MWCVITWLVYKSTKALPQKKRVWIVLLVLFFPIIGGMIISIGDSLSKSINGYMSSPLSEIATEPITLAGAVFPAGSEVKYQRTSLLSKVPVEVTPSEPVSFAALQISHLRLIGYPEPEQKVIASLSRTEKIEGWQCTANSDVMLHRDAEGWILDQCVLDTAITIGNINWPAGTEISRLPKGSPEITSEEGGWKFSLGHFTGNNCNCPIRGADLPFANFTASYDLNFQLSSVGSGEICTGGNKGLRQIGQFSVDNSYTTALLLPDRSIEIKGFFRYTNTNSGDFALCLLLDANGKNPKVCKDEPALQH